MTRSLATVSSARSRGWPGVRRRSERDDWSLRQGDAPPAIALVREPRLQGVENNPVFRLAVHRRRAGGLAGRLSQLPGGVASAALALALAAILPLATLFIALWLFIGFAALIGAFALSGFAAAAVALAAILLVRAYLWRPLCGLFRRNDRPISTTWREAASRTSIAESPMRDLLLAGVDARTIALGFWAAELSESERRRRSRLCLAAFIVLAACSPIAGAFPPFVSSFVLFAMLVVGFHWSILGATPHHVLARLLATVRYSVGTARSRSQVAYLAWRWLYPGWAAARSTILVLIFAFLGLAFLPGLARVFLVTDPAMAPLQTIGVFAFGWTLGKARGRFLETQAGDLVPQIIAEVEAYRDRFKAHLDARA